MQINGIYKYSIFTVTQRYELLQLISLYLNGALRIYITPIPPYDRPPVFT